MLYKWNHKVYSLLFLASFTQYNALEIHPRCCTRQFIPFFYLSSIEQIYHNLFIHSLAVGYLGCFQGFAIMNKTAVNICKQEWIAGSYVECISLHKNLLSYFPMYRFAFPPAMYVFQLLHVCRHLVFSAFFIWAILLCKWCLLAVFLFFFFFSKRYVEGWLSIACSEGAVQLHTTLTQKQVVYEWFNTRFPRNVPCVTCKEAAPLSLN